MKNFAIIAHPRCGSTTLCHLLDVHPDVCVDQEPYNPDRVNWPWNGDGEHYCPRIDIEKGMKVEETLDKIFESYFTGIKHMYSQVDKKTNGIIFNYVEKIIFLTRKNILQAVVSHEISRQTGNWQGGKKANEGYDFKPLNISIIKEEIERTKKGNGFYRSYLKSQNLDFLEMEYSQFYGGVVEEKIQRYQNILNYLDVPPLSGPDQIARIGELFDPSDNKISDLALYKRIPNIHEINTLFGNDENGYIL